MVVLLTLALPGFKMMEAFGLTDKTYSQHSGVSMVPGSMNVFTAYLLHPGSKLEQPTRCDCHYCFFIVIKTESGPINQSHRQLFLHKQLCVKVFKRVFLFTGSKARSVAEYMRQHGT